MRENVCRQLIWLGAELDAAANAASAAHISTPASQVAVPVLPTNEEWRLARHAAELIT